MSEEEQEAAARKMRAKALLVVLGISAFGASVAAWIADGLLGASFWIVFLIVFLLSAAPSGYTFLSLPSSELRKMYEEEEKLNEKEEHSNSETDIKVRKRGFSLSRFIRNCVTSALLLFGFVIVLALAIHFRRTGEFGFPFEKLGFKYWLPGLLTALGVGFLIALVAEFSPWSEHPKDSKMK